MTWLRKLSWLQLFALLAVPLTAFAITWSAGGFSAPANFRQAAHKLGLRVTQVCRPSNANYGARSSLHKRCLAMDIGKETPASKIAGLEQFGLCGEFHQKGYFGATADHWHVSACSDGASRRAARKDQREKAQSIRNQNQSRATGSRPSAAVRDQRTRTSEIRRQNQMNIYPSRGNDNDWVQRAFGTR